MQKIVMIKDEKRRAGVLSQIKKQIKDAFSEEGQAAADALRALVDEIEASEVEVDVAEFEKQVVETIKKYNGKDDSDVPAAVANAIAKRFSDMQQRMPQGDKLSVKVKNEVSAAILRARGKEDVKNAVNAVLVKNGISSIAFEEVVDYAVSENWGDGNKLFAALNKTPFSKFFYSSQDTLASGVLAHGWDKTSSDAKEIQEIVATGKTISTQYIYKRQQIAQEDLDDMKALGSETNFLRWLNEELDRQIINTIIGTMLGGTTDVTSIESLFGTGITDAFRTAVVTTATSAAGLTIADVRALADAVSNPYGKEKWLVIDQTTLTAISSFIYGTGGTESYRGIEELKGQLGVDNIFVTPLAANPIVFIPSGYWVKEKNAISVTYPTYEFNAINFQKERNIGGGVHDIKSVAFHVYA